MDNADFLIDTLASHTALALQFEVFVGVEEGNDDLDVEDEQGGGVAARVDGCLKAGDLEWAVVEVPCYQGLIGRDDSGQGDDEHETERHVTEESSDAVHDAAVARAVVLDRVSQGEDGYQPAAGEEEGGGFEAGVSGRGRGFVEGLLGVALKLDGGPIPRHDHEEVLSRLVNRGRDVGGAMV